jgi:hypothetical protein
MSEGVIWDTPFLQVYTDYGGDIVLHERPRSTNDFIFVPPDELRAFCKHYLSLFKSEADSGWDSDDPRLHDMLLRKNKEVE